MSSCFFVVKVRGRAVQRSITRIALERGNSLVFGGVVHNDNARESNLDVWIDLERGFMRFDPDSSDVERDAVPSVPIEIGTGFRGSFVIFDARVHERSVQCSIAREALVQYSWAPSGASDAQLLNSYADGRKRIKAIVCRKLLATQGEAVGLSMSDFAR